MKPDTATTARLWRALLIGHRVGPALAIAVAAALTQALGPRTVPVPAILSIVDVHATLVVLCALAFAIAVTQLTYEPAAPIAATSVRGWSRTRLIRLATGTILSLALAAATAPGQTRLAAVNACLVLLAEGLLAARMLGATLAWTLPTAHLTAALVFGYNADGQTHQWAWFIDVHCTLGELLLAAAATLAVTPWWAGQPADRATEID